MKYPNGIKQQKTDNKVNYANRGMNLENDLNISNSYYIDKKIAFIYKKPTPIQVTKVDYPSRNKAVIKEAFFKEPSTTDYNGIYCGNYIDFEAKETNSRTAFPLNNINKHQIKHIENIYNAGGICFLIVRFNHLNSTYVLTAKDFLDYLSNNTKKSIPIKYFKEHGYLIEEKFVPRLDYLKIIDQILGGVKKWMMLKVKIKL